jgi:hypothetical protein
VPITMRNNWIFASPGELAYKVASNFTNYLELGAPDVTPYYLVASIEEDEFLVSAVILNPKTGNECRVVNNFPDKSPGFDRRMTTNGYQIVDSTGHLVLGIETINPKICLLRGTILDKDGSVVAEDQGDDFLIYRGPAILGRANGAIGIMID